MEMKETYKSAGNDNTASMTGKEGWHLHQATPHHKTVEILMWTRDFLP
jgi:hypothetical protein